MPHVQGVLDHFLRGPLVQGPVVHGARFAKAHAAHAYFGNFNVGAAQLGVLHGARPSQPSASGRTALMQPRAFRVRGKPI